MDYHKDWYIFWGQVNGAPEQIFVDGFESMPDHFAPWYDVDTGGGAMTASTDAAAIDDYGAEFLIDDTVRMSLRTFILDGVQEYSARFYVDPNALSMGSWKSHYIYYALDEYDWIHYLEFGYDGDDYFVMLEVLEDNDQYTQSQEYTLDDDWNVIELNWRASSGAGVDDGVMALYLNDSLVETLSGLDDDTITVDQLGIGALSSINASTSGTFYLDGMAWRRAGHIGLDPDGPGMGMMMSMNLPGGLTAESVGLADSDSLNESLPEAVGHYRARFYLDPNSALMPEGGSLKVYELLDEKDGAVVHLYLHYEKGEYWLLPEVYDAKGDFRFGEYYHLNNNWNAIEIDWQAADKESVKAGYLQVWVNDQMVGSIDEVQNGGMVVSSYGFGVLDTDKNDINGRILFDWHEIGGEDYIGLIVGPVVFKGLTTVTAPRSPGSSSELPTETAVPTMTATPTATPMPSQTIEPTQSPTSTAVPTATEDATPTPEPSFTPTPTPEPTPTATQQGSDESGYSFDKGAVMLFAPNGWINPLSVTMFERPEKTEPETIAQYIYDGDGVMVKSIVEGVTTYYVGGYYEVEENGSDTIERKYYSAAGMRIAMRTIVNGTTDTLNWLLGDHLGSTSMVADETGEVVSEVRYSAFGEERYNSGTMTTDYLYTGQRQEAEVGLYYYVARWYDPAIGRFIQADSVVPDPESAKGFDRFAYVGNNPLRYIDPSGHFMEGACGFGGGGCGSSYNGEDENTISPLSTGDILSGIGEAIVGTTAEIADFLSTAEDFNIPLVFPIGFDNFEVNGQLVRYTIAHGSELRKFGAFLDSIPSPVFNAIGWGLQIGPAQFENIWNGKPLSDFVADLIVDGTGLLIGEVAALVGGSIGAAIGGLAGGSGGTAVAPIAGTLSGGVAGIAGGTVAGAFTFDLFMGLRYESFINRHQIRDLVQNGIEVLYDHNGYEAFPNITPVPSP